MPTHIRAQVACAVGTTLPRDTMQVTPCFRHQAILPTESPDWQNLADDLLEIFTGWAVGAATRQWVVKLYQIGLPKPNRPKAIAMANVGLSAEAGSFREMAVCLSFTAGNNLPQNRGRLYLPRIWLNSGAPGVRPLPAELDRVELLPPLLAGLGGVDVDWGVWSPTQAAFSRAERWWVDDEYDVQRKRGLRPTTRREGTTGG